SLVDARVVDVLAVRGLSLIGLTDSILRPSIVASPTRVWVRVLLMDPRSRSTRRRAEELGESQTSLGNGIQICLDSLTKLAIDAVLQVYLYDELPVWRLVRINDVLYVSAFARQRGGPKAPVYKITNTPEGALFDGFQRGFEELAARSWRV